MILVQIVSQTVKINSIISDLYTFKCGIPQATVLGHIVLLIYEEDFLHLDIDGNILAFADTVLFFKGENCRTEAKMKANLGQ